MNDDLERIRALRDLVELRTSVAAASSALAAYEWDSEDELLTLDLSHFRVAITRYSRSELSEAELVGWAEALQGREDIRIDPEHEEQIKDALFHLSTPELFGTVPEIVSQLQSEIL